MPVLIDTQSVPERQRLDFWQESNRLWFNPLHMSGGPKRDFSASLWGEPLGPIGVFRISGNGGTMIRTMADVAAGDPECVQLSLLESGSLHCAQGRRAAMIKAGEMTSYDTSAPAVVRAPGPYEILALRVPKTLLRERASRISRLTALPIPTGSGWPRMAARMYRELADGLASGSFTRDDEELIELAIYLMRHIYSEVPASPRGNLSARAELLVRAQAYIDSHLDDLSLGPEQVAHACYASVRSLHYAFSEAGLTVGRFIRDQRLERARHDLADQTLRGESVAAIGRRWGFASAAHFSRQFRAAYGRPPRELRRSARAGERRGAAEDLSLNFSYPSPQGRS